MKDFLILLALIFLVTTAGCGSSGIGTGVSNPPTNTSDKAASAVAGLFGGQSNSNITASRSLPAKVLDLFIRQAIAQETCTNDPGCTCDSAGSSEGANDQIDDATFGSAGTYGSSDNSKTVTADHFCTQPDGTANTGNGPDGIGRFAAFTISTDVVGNCVDSDSATSTVTMKTGSSGIWRNTDASGSTPAYFPQIYGTFTMETDGSSAQFNCTIFLDENETALFADCSDENGTAVEQDTSTTCTFSTSS